MFEAFLRTLPRRFPHRFEETEESLKIREWRKDLSIDKVLQRILEECVYVDAELYCDLYVRHHFYCAATALFDFPVTNFDEFHAMLKNAKAGDFFEVWTLSETPNYFVINCPNEQGMFPKKGSSKVLLV